MPELGPKAVPAFAPHSAPRFAANHCGAAGDGRVGGVKFEIVGGGKLGDEALVLVRLGGTEFVVHVRDR